MQPGDAGRPLSGQVALVTGAAGGIGNAVCRFLGRDGAITVGMDRSHPDVPDDSLQEALTGDVGDEGDVKSAIDVIETSFDRLDIVVHCAALPQGGVVWKLPVTEFDRIIQVNLRSAFLLAHYGIPLMRRGNAGGRIILIGSTSGSTGRLGQSAYAASKAGLLGFAKSVARETAKFGILVNVIEPGLIRTSMSDALPEDLRQSALKEILLGKMGEPDDIASMVAFLSGPGGAAHNGPGAASGRRGVPVEAVAYDSRPIARSAGSYDSAIARLRRYAE